MNRFLITIFLLAFVIGCSKQSSENIPAHIKNLENLTIYSVDAVPPLQIQAEQEQVFGDTKKVLIDELTDIAVDAAGRVYIADVEQDHVIVYEPNGDFVTFLGREGKGPAEFTNLQDLQTTENLLFAYDNSQKKTVAFSLGSLNHKYNVIIDGKYYIRNDGSFLKKSIRIVHEEKLEDWDKIVRIGAYYLLNDEGKMMSDTLFEMKSGIRVPVPVGGYSVGRPVGMYPKSVTALSGDNHIYQAWTKDFLIKIYGPKGEYQQAFYYPYERAPLSLESASAAGILEFKLKGFNQMELSDTWPALNAMLIDDQNRLWISTITEDEQVYQWWVLDSQGKLIARFEWPRNNDIKIIKGSHFYTRKENEDTGLDKIVRYKFELPVNN